MLAVFHIIKFPHNHCVSLCISCLVICLTVISATEEIIFVSQSLVLQKIYFPILHCFMSHGGCTVSISEVQQTTEMHFIKSSTTFQLLPVIPTPLIVTYL
jgi:hypothetical protein